MSGIVADGGAEVITRVWAMPSRHTFTIRPISDLLTRYCGGVIVDPFCGQSTIGVYRNDLALGGLESRDWLRGLIVDGVRADVVLLDPPYSPRQISECYKSVGREVSATDTQNARLVKECKALLDELLVIGGIAITLGWNSSGFTLDRYKRLETMMVCHGGAHNDTIVTVDKKTTGVQCALNFRVTR